MCSWSWNPAQTLQWNKDTTCFIITLLCVRQTYTLHAQNVLCLAFFNENGLQSAHGRSDFEVLRKIRCQVWVFYESEVKVQHVLSFYERAHTAIISAISRLQLGLSVESVCCCCCLNVRSGPLRLNKSLHICEKIVMVHLGSNMINTSSFEQPRGRNHHFGQVKSIWTCLTFHVKMTRFWLFL